MINRFCAALAVATSAVLVSASAIAQTPPAAPKSAPKADPKAAPKAPAKSPAPAAQAPAAPAAPTPVAATSGNSIGTQAVQVIYTPWIKICQKAPQAQGAAPKDVCITTRTSLLDIGQPVMTAEIIAMEGEKKVLRLTMPLVGIMLARGSQFYIDSNPPRETQFSTCVQSGCWADYEADDGLIASMKSGQNLVARAFDLGQQLITLTMPLAGEFGKVHDGPATDQTTLQAQQKKIQDIVQEAQKKMQQQQQQQGGAAAPAK